MHRLLLISILLITFCVYVESKAITSLRGDIVIYGDTHSGIIESRVLKFFSRPMVMLSDPNSCSDENLLRTVHGETGAMIVVLVTRLRRDKCKLTPQARTTLLKITASSENVQLETFSRNQFISGLRFTTSIGNDELDKLLRLVTDSITYFNDPLSRLQSDNDGSVFKRRVGKPQDDGVVLVPSWIVALVACVGCVALVLAVALLISQRQKSKKRIDHLIKEHTFENRKKGLNDDEKLAAEEVKLLEKRYSNQHQSNNVATGLKDDPSDDVFVGLQDFVADLRRVTSFCAKGCEEPAKENKIMQSNWLMQRPMQDWQTEWNAEPHHLESLLTRVRYILHEDAGKKKPRDHSSPSGIWSLADVVVNAVCNSLEACGILKEGASAFSELERVIVNWLGEAFGLPKTFLFAGGTLINESRGGGCIQGAPLESVLTALVAAAQRVIASAAAEGTRLKELTSLVAYASTEADAAFIGACQIAGVRASFIPCDQNYQLDSKALNKQIKHDIRSGLRPFFVLATVGAQSTGTNDDLFALDTVVEKYNLWLHVAAGYAGNSLICREYRYLLGEIDLIDSITVSVYTSLLLAPMGVFTWTRHSREIGDSYPMVIWLLGSASGGAPSNLHCNRAHSSYKALKAFFLMRLNGIQGLQCRTRKTNEMAARLMKELRLETNIELAGVSLFPVLAFSCKKDKKDLDLNEKTFRLCAFIIRSDEMLVSLVKARTLHVIRMFINWEYASEVEMDETARVLRSLISRWQGDEKNGQLMSTAECRRYVDDAQREFSVWSSHPFIVTDLLDKLAAVLTARAKIQKSRSGTSVPAANVSYQDSRIRNKGRFVVEASKPIISEESGVTSS